jgi:hypothetical protein
MKKPKIVIALDGDGNISVYGTKGIKVTLLDYTEATSPKDFMTLDNKLEKLTNDLEPLF